MPSDAGGTIACPVHVGRGSVFLYSDRQWTGLRTTPPRKSLSGLSNPPSGGPWSPRVQYPPSRSPGVLSTSSRGRGCPFYRPVCGARDTTAPPPPPHPTPAPRARGAEKQAWARPRVGNKGAQAKRVTHRTRTGTRAPGVADPAGPGAGLKPSWVSTFSLPRLGGGTISVPWGHAATSDLGGHSGSWGLQPYQRTDVRDPQECAE